jgi:hypothetical protein
MNAYLVLGALIVSAPSAFAAVSPITLSGSDARVFSKIMKLVGVSPSSPNQGITQYALGATDCLSEVIEASGLPSFRCTSESAASGLSQEIGATALYQAMLEAGTLPNVSSRKISVSSIICSLDSQGEGTCVIVPAIQVVAPTGSAS